MAKSVDLGALGFAVSRKAPSDLTLKELRSFACQVTQLFVVTDGKLDPTAYAADVRSSKHKAWADYCLSCAKLYGEKLKANA
jgi:hypothetical protein